MPKTPSEPLTLQEKDAFVAIIATCMKLPCTEAKLNPNGKVIGTGATGPTEYPDATKVAERLLRRAEANARYRDMLRENPYNVIASALGQHAQAVRDSEDGVRREPPARGARLGCDPGHFAEHKNTYGPHRGDPDRTR